MYCYILLSGRYRFRHAKFIIFDDAQSVEIMTYLLGIKPKDHFMCKSIKYVRTCILIFRFILDPFLYKSFKINFLVVTIFYVLTKF